MSQKSQERTLVNLRPNSDISDSYGFRENARQASSTP